MEDIIPLLEGIYSETNASIRAKIEAQLDERCKLLLTIAKSPKSFIILLSRVIAEPLIGDPLSSFY